MEPQVGGADFFTGNTRLEHSNIVRFLGYCSDTQGTVEVRERLLCLEYLSGGNLGYSSDDIAFALPKAIRQRKPWAVKFAVAASAKGDTEIGSHVIGVPLYSSDNDISDKVSPRAARRYKMIRSLCFEYAYWHVKLSTSVIPLELKSQNILLDNSLVPKIADFGLSKRFDDERTQTTLHLLGTNGYCSPEFIEQNYVSDKFDIYSLGVLILEIMAGSEGYRKTAEIPSQEFFYHVQENWRKRVIHEYHQMKRCIEIGLFCINPYRKQRRNIGDITSWLDETENNTENWPGLLPQKKRAGSQVIHVPKYLSDNDLCDEARWADLEEIHQRESSYVEFAVAASAKGGTEIKIGSHVIRVPKYLSVHHPLVQMVLFAYNMWDVTFACFESMVPKSIFDMAKRLRASALSNWCKTAWNSARPKSEPPKVGTVSDFGTGQSIVRRNELPENETHPSDADASGAVWVAATAAPHHATGNRNLLAGFISEHDDLFVHAVDGVPRKVFARGAVMTDSVVLPDVWFVPGLTKNLVSVSQLVELDHSVDFSRGNCCIRRSDGKVVGKGRLQDGGLYVLDFVKVPLAI